MAEMVDNLKLYHNTKLSSYEQCILFLLFATGGSSFGYLSRSFGLSKTSISTIVQRVSQSINSSLQSIHLPETPSEWRNIESTFVRRNMLPALGALDGKHVRIRAPPRSGSMFYNYKNFFSFVLLALVDGDGRFIWIDVGNGGLNFYPCSKKRSGSPGSVNDASIFNKSNLKHLLDDPNNLPKPTFWNETVVMPSFVVADGIFQLSHAVMKPFSRRSLTAEELVYNRKLSNARVRVEHSFGLLAKKFRLLDRSIEFNYKGAVELVTSLCHIHNLLIGPPDANVVLVGEESEVDVNPYKDAKEQREHLKNYLSG